MSSFTPKPCPECGSIWHSKSYHKPRKPLLARKRMKPFGKQGKRYSAFRDETARPYLIKTFGEKCANCGITGVRLDVDHIKKRGSSPELKYTLSNLQLLCRPCHDKKDNQI